MDTKDRRSISWTALEIAYRELKGCWDQAVESGYEASSMAAWKDALERFEVLRERFIHSGKAPE
jgi:hypothetical protein